MEGSPGGNRAKRGSIFTTPLNENQEIPEIQEIVSDGQREVREWTS